MNAPLMRSRGGGSNPSKDSGRSGLTTTSSSGLSSDRVVHSWPALPFLLLLTAAIVHVITLRRISVGYDAATRGILAASTPRSSTPLDGEPAISSVPVLQKPPLTGVPVAFPADAFPADGLSTFVLPSSLEQLLDHEPDYNGLIIESEIDNSAAGDDAQAAYEQFQQQRHERMASDWDEESYFGGYRSSEYPEDACKMPDWAVTAAPNCNQFHERHPVNDNQKFLGHGFYRNTFLVDAKTDPHVLKTTILERDWNRQRLQHVLTEAVIMDHMTGSPVIARTYGYCAFSIIVEPAPIDISKQILPMTDLQFFQGKIEQATLDEKQVDDVYPLNQHHLSVVEKLHMALQMTRSIAELHGADTGPILLNDIAVNQWLQTADGRIVLGDFDNAEFLTFNGTDYCPMEMGHLGGFKAPETIPGPTFITESTDMFKVSGLLFSILTGLVPFYHELHMAEVDLFERQSGVLNTTVRDQKLLRGEMPYIDPRYENRSFIEGRLYRIMKRCYQFDPVDRVSIFEVIEYLEETLHLYKEEGHMTNLRGGPTKVE
jgi:hypothetical protein